MSDMELASNRRVLSAEDVGHAQSRTKAPNGAIETMALSTPVGCRYVINVDDGKRVQLPEDVRHAQPRTNAHNKPSDTGAAGILSDRFCSESRQQGKGEACDQSNESHIGSAQGRAASIADVETTKMLRSVREDVLSEIRCLKVVLLEEIQNARNHATFFSTTHASASPLYKLAASSPEPIAATQHNMNAMMSERSVAVEECADTIEVAQETLSSDQLSPGRSSGLTAGAPRGLSFIKINSCDKRKSTARRHDEAILEDLRQQRTFANPDRTKSEDIKSFLRDINTRELNDALSRYHETGFCQQVAKHYLFVYGTLAVVVLNAVWMAVDTDLNDADSINNAPLLYVLADVMFYTFYVIEILVRFLIFRRKTRFYKDRWFVFDLVLVILYTLDPFVLGIIQYASGEDNAGGLGLSMEGFRLFRLVRLFRLTRLLRNVPVFLTIVEGIATALASVGYTSCLLALVTYVFAIALRNMVPEHSEIEIRYFPTIFETMHNLLLHGAFVDSLSVFIRDVKDGSAACFVLSWLYIFLTNLLIMNLLIGILCEVMSMVANDAQENFVANKINDKFIKLLSEYDGSEEGHIGWEEFAQFLQTRSCQHALKKFEIDVDVLVDMVEDQFFCSNFEGGAIKISFKQIVELLVDLRGSKTASVKDVMIIGRRLNTKFLELKENLEALEIRIHGSTK